MNPIERGARIKNERRPMDLFRPLPEFFFNDEELLDEIEQVE